MGIHFDELSEESREQLWATFLKKLGADITKAQIRSLSKRNVNGRQIKNAVKVANLLAVGKGDKINFGHLVETLDAVDEFAAQFKAVSSPT